MLEPVQSCFTFYHPDGISQPHDYSSANDENKFVEEIAQARSIVAQQDLPLREKQMVNNPLQNS